MSVTICRNVKGPFSRHFTKALRLSPDSVRQIEGSQSTLRQEFRCKPDCHRVTLADVPAEAGGWRGTV